jgi:hypothetical protein
MPGKSSLKSTSQVPVDSSCIRITRASSACTTSIAAHSFNRSRLDSDATTVQSQNSDSSTAYTPVASSKARSSKIKSKGKPKQTITSTVQTAPVAALETVVSTDATSDSANSHPKTAATSTTAVKQYISSVAQLAKHKSILETVPVQHRIAWTRACAAAFTAYVQAPDKSEPQLIALTNLLALPSVCLTRASGGKRNLVYEQINRNSPSGKIAQRISAAELALRDETSSLLFHMQQAPMSSARANNHSACLTDSPMRDAQAIADANIANKVRRAIIKVRSGYSRRAARMLVQSQSVISPCTEAQIDIVRALHPPCTSVFPSLPSSSNEIVTAIDSATIQRVLPRLCNGSSAGLSGWNADHLIVLVNDTTCMSGLAKLVCDILNDRLSDEARQYVVACHLVCLPKDNDENNLRPIAIGEIFYRLAAAIAYSLCSTTIKEKLNRFDNES